MYEFRWIAGDRVTSELSEQMAKLYSSNYGFWSRLGPRPGASIKLSVDKLRGWLSPADSRVALASKSGKLVGYAIAVQTDVQNHGIVSWVTQLVVDEHHRQENVAKRLLFTIWQFSNHFAWGLITANPFAVRALEKATRRRCIPTRIRQHRDMLLTLAPRVAPTYFQQTIEAKVTATESQINTSFPLDHSQLQEMLLKATGEGRRWELGPLNESWEWFAFTFHDQPQISLSRVELEQMLLASDEVTKQAYSRVSQAFAKETQPWARHTDVEVDFIIETCRIEPNDDILDFGCGQGRHAIEMARTGINVVGVDYVEQSIAAANIASQSMTNIEFVLGDCRFVNLGRTFDAAVCLYDVIGSYADDRDNLLIVQNLAAHVKAGAHVFLSVMNFELTAHQSLNRFSIVSEPDRLLSLPASNTMEKTGIVFNPAYYLLDAETQIVYRKEQFVLGESLPAELLVRDKRFTKAQIEDLCKAAGFDVVLSRFVQAGHWRDPLSATDKRAKEILVVCRKPGPPPPTLFELT
jgi:2-polyprenyl-3-methyl-5-hydroxy-6-metoxy-1,4-benzoquinol methylase